jgi:hypothetical protein
MITLTSSNESTVELYPADGGQFFMDLNGNFNSGSVAVLISVDGGTNYSPLTTAVGTDLSVTADYNAVVTLPGDSIVKFDATSVTSVKIQLNKI